MNVRSSVPTPQHGWSVQPPGQSGTYRVVPDGRHEDLIGFDPGHWIVRDSGRGGAWLSTCIGCGKSQENRLDDGQIYIPRCKACGRSSRGVDLRVERERFFNSSARE